MRKSIYTATAPQLVDTEYDDELKSVIATWYNFYAPKDLQASCQAQLKAVQEDGCKSIIVDCRQTKGVVRQEDQEWMDNYLFPEYVKAGLKAIITILPKSALSKLSTMNYKKTGSQHGIHMYECKDMETAEKLAKEQFA